MFMGVTNRGSRTTDYASALVALEAASLTPTGNRRTEKPDGFPLGGHSKSVTWVRKLSHNDGIAFKLYETDVVTWYPSGQVEVENFGTVTTSSFAHRFLPRGFHLSHPSREGGHKGVTYPAADGSRRICFGSSITFDPDGVGYIPRADHCQDIRLPVGVDAKRTRALLKDLHFADFERWLEWAPMHLSAGSNEIEHDEFDLCTVTDALLDRNFLRAAQYLPLVKEPNGFGTAGRMKPLPISTGKWNEHVTMGSLTKLKLALYKQEGLLAFETDTTWGVNEFARGMAKVKQLESIGVDVSDMGTDW